MAYSCRSQGGGKRPHSLAAIASGHALITKVTQVHAMYATA
jgi:hypothetical protein